MKALILLLSFLNIGSLNQTFAAGELPQAFTFDGRLYSDSSGSSPLSDSNITIKLQILDHNQTCVLYEETQTGVNTSSSSGYFTLQVGSSTASTKRTNDPGNSMAKVYSNSSAITGKLLSNGSACTYTPVAGDQRYLRMTVTPSSTGVASTLSPNMPLNSVPNAIVAERAESFQGKSVNEFILANNTGPASLTQSNLENIFSNTNYPLLTSLLAGTSTLYTKSTSNGTTALSNISSPTSPTAGQIWYDSGTIKFYNGSSIQTLGTSGAGITALVVGAGLTPTGTITTSGSIAVDVGTTAGKIVQVQTGGKLPTLDGSDLTNLNGSAISSGTIGGSTGISTTGNIVTSGSVTAGTNFLYDHSGAGPGYIGFSAPNSVTAYTLTWPAAAPAASGYVLSSTTSGVLSWVPASAGNATSITSGTLDSARLPAFTGDTMSSAGTSITTTMRVNGVSYPASPSINTVPVVTGANTITYKTVPIASGGTGATTAVEALTNLLPSQTGNSGKVLHTDGTNVSWISTGGIGTVTSITAGAGLTGGTITGSGTIGLSSELAGLNDLSTNGFIKRNSAGSYSASPAISLATDISGTLPIENGGTGATTATAALNNLLPLQTGNASKILQTDGSNASWIAVPTTGITAITGDVNASGTGSVAATIANDAVTSAKILDGTVSVADLNFAGAMLTNTGILVRDGSQFFNKTCSSNQALIWSVANGWICSAVTLTESDPKVGANTTNYVSKWNGSALVTSGVYESGGNVGIGTASPGQKLSVAGTIESTSGGIKFPDGTTQTTAATPIVKSTTIYQCPAGAGANECGNCGGQMTLSSTCTSCSRSSGGSCVNCSTKTCSSLGRLVQ